MTSLEQPTNKKRGQIIKITVIVLVILVLVLAGIAGWLFVDSTSAVNQYVSDVDNQYKDIVAGNNLDQPNIELRSVTFGDLLNPKYKRTKELTTKYNELADQLRAYTAAMELHNQLVEQFNQGIQGDEILNSQMLETANKLAEAIKKYYPDNIEEIAAAESLCQTIASSTNFGDISVEVNRVLHANDEWLGGERDDIEAKRLEFQQAINSL